MEYIFVQGSIISGAIHYNTHEYGKYSPSGFQGVITSLNPVDKIVKGSAAFKKVYDEETNKLGNFIIKADADGFPSDDIARLREELAAVVHRINATAKNDPDTLVMDLQTIKDGGGIDAVLAPWREAGVHGVGVSHFDGGVTLFPCIELSNTFMAEAH